MRAKAIALNPSLKSHNAAVLTLGASEAVEIVDTNSGRVLQNYVAFGKDAHGSFNDFRKISSMKRRDEENSDPPDGQPHQFQLRDGQTVYELSKFHSMRYRWSLGQCGSEIADDGVGLRQ